MRKSFFISILLIILCVVKAQENKNRQVVNIYPTTDSIPVNILRFYVQFSTPMQEMDILKHIHLTNEDGKNITGVFFENQYELWNHDRTEVTLIVDPGRVKLGLLANNSMGRAFDEGVKYTLTVDSLLLDFNDQTLSRSFTKTFIAIKEDRSPPDTKSWEIDLPKKDSKEALIIHFKDKIDHVSAQSLIKIFKDNKEINGTMTLQNEEQNGIFLPDRKWKKGDYEIIINPRLEDIAANSVNQVFDHKPSDFKQNNNTNYLITFKIN